MEVGNVKFCFILVITFPNALIRLCKFLETLPRPTSDLSSSNHEIVHLSVLSKSWVAPRDLPFGAFH